ncbi:hypothetical protein [Luteimonas suaedae]|uniref:hypothetical protein n=1 Tax=Luteimonas suaedae TaxID=2605430 RepID=UPI0011EE059D|nr:hypothetical protein [Luteimonas suaedae]
MLTFPHLWPRSWRRLPLPLAFACLLAACSAEPPAVPAPADQGEPAARPSPPQDAGATPDAGPGTQPVTQPLPPERQLQVTVEGQTELRSATLFESPQGYALYVLPQIAMTQEEPCCDLAYARVDDGFFMRIERIDPEQDLGTLRENMELALSGVGTAEDVPAGQAGADNVRDAELFLRARGDDLTVNMLVARIDGGRYRITLHLPHREAAEGINPSLWAMLESLRTTGPRPEI